MGDIILHLLIQQGQLYGHIGQVMYQLKKITCIIVYANKHCMFCYLKLPEKSENIQPQSAMIKFCQI